MQTKYKIVFALLIISFGIAVQIAWLLFCFSTVIVGIALLFFAPRVLFFPFNFFFELSFKTLGKYFFQNHKYRKYKFYNQGARNYGYDYYRQNFEQARSRTDEHSGFRHRNYNFNYDNNNYDDTYNVYESDEDKFYKILESSKNDSFDTIKKRYRQLVKKYHYDTIISQNPTQEQIKEAEKKTQQINEAYSYIKNLYKKR